MRHWDGAIEPGVQKVMDGGTQFVLKRCFLITLQEVCSVFFHTCVTLLLVKWLDYSFKASILNLTELLPLPNHVIIITF